MNQLAQDSFTPFPGISAQVYCRADFEAVRDIVYDIAGIVLPPGKATLVYSRLAPLVRDSGQQTFSRYIDFIRTDADARRKTINALTTNHTFFYRESHHFEHLAEEVRPMLLDKIRSRQPVRVWSSACSTGEELYSLAMTLLGPDKAGARPFLEGDLAILATDLADHAVAGAKAATYPYEALKDVPAELKNAWVKREGDQAIIAPELCRKVHVKRLNLLGDWPIRKQFDVIFCRNVMIYFDQPTKDRLVARLADQLLPGGHLYIGHSERVAGPAQTQLTLVGSTIYRKGRM
ncbi:MAG: protein-glutamate O-methyltransferase CheR [Sphingobium sp.]|jgi:chemotaxis protein methyltransferase CheR|nr:protein-glutamate O-methyltransferase CheR [Sphingobium sp.]MCI1271430.1 protein-glutamate O-methyltransferase CheR [Sphingobium sp.]MCI1755647.1 protein-glutamate O-methyltransferase CheR [Sphingobium sp.]MCI2052543.1 protein-glutamate O-methyltransferase CheR [Sphingobium sp.]